MVNAVVNNQAMAAQVWAVLEQVLDPEVPALSICDLGIVRDVQWNDGEGVEVVLTPTYSGCPATEVIEQSVLAAIDQAGLGPATVRLQRAPAWTTDWLSDAGRRKLKDYGIAPPGHMLPKTEQTMLFFPRRESRFPAALACPRCDSTHTEMLSAFGSTACKSLYRCMACKEPFEHFKPI
jgi:ring-1,2-phenylacetyl-CoA epoxidase subunit PaaD